MMASLTTVNVYVRVRPPESHQKSAWEVDDSTLLTTVDKERRFDFGFCTYAIFLLITPEPHHVVQPCVEASQFYERVAKPVVMNALKGYHGITVVF